MSIAIRIKDCIDNHEKYVAIMATLPDKELAKKLDLVHIQSEIAEQTKNTGSLELLEVWHQQIIEARIYKAENDIPDAPNEIELAIADIETFVSKSEARQEIMSDLANPAKQSRPKVQQQQDNDSQLSLF
ncbi:MAG: hypothetical protein IPM51_10555 [Sphingobacteriaceae bacterium]|nr:hypothetical protein [Sphingobacteriaceae bacterium]